MSSALKVERRWMLGVLQSKAMLPLSVIPSEAQRAEESQSSPYLRFLHCGLAPCGRNDKCAADALQSR